MPRPAARHGLCLLLVLALGCAPTQQASSVRPSGFLGDYSQLAPGGDGQALLVQLREDADWASYARVWIDPITVWHSQGSGLDDVPQEELQGLVDYLDASLRARLGREYELVDHPGAKTLRLRVAITEARGSRVVADTVSTVIPQLRMLSSLGSLATGTHAFVGRAGVEAEILDSLTGERLAAAVDRRAGAKSLSGSTHTWSDVQQAFDHWSAQLADRLAELRTRAH